ncbi:MAG: septum site-determining protein MinC [Cyanobacteriota bacterium]|jgi:septum site-determining protein MinC
MAAALIPALAPDQLHLLRLPQGEGVASALEEVHQAVRQSFLQGAVGLESGDWLLRVPELRDLQNLLQRHGLELRRVHSRCPGTLVAAAALGLEQGGSLPVNGAGDKAATKANVDPLTVHRGTLRSGDHLQVEGSVLLLGDVNPGARISAGGHVLVWGRLRGMAHAGCGGNRSARIVALQLRPLQLRIADAVARGPEERPPAGLAEEALLVNGTIRIDPASPSWPLPQ